MKRRFSVPSETPMPGGEVRASCGEADPECQENSLKLGMTNEKRHVRSDPECQEDSLKLGMTTEKRRHFSMIIFLLLTKLPEINR